jgi:hypothetical protein
MTPHTEAIKPQVFKQIAVRWPEDFWRRAKIAAMDMNVSLAHAATIGAATFLGIDPPSEADDVTEEALSAREAVGPVSGRAG